jgi:hypothetical protein
MIAQTANRFAMPAAKPPKAVAARMADFITRHSASAGGVTHDDLLLDFTAEEITANIEAAKRMARNAGKARR